MKIPGTVPFLHQVCLICIMLKGSAANFTIWTAYIKSSTFSSLLLCSQSNRRNIRVITNFKLCQLKHQLVRKRKMQVNFGKQYRIKSIIGRIKLPLSSKTKMQIFDKTFWEIKLDRRLKMNMTFLFFDVGQE